MEKYKVPKEDIANISLAFKVVDNSIKVEDIEVEVFDKDDILSKNVTEDIKSALI